MIETAVSGLRTESGRGPSTALSDRLPRPWLFPLLAFAVTWVIVVVTWHIANEINHSPQPWTAYFWIGDGVHYRDIARYGYGNPILMMPRHGRGSPFVATFLSAWFPLLPVLIRLVSYATLGNFVAAGLIVQILAGAASAVAVWALAVRVRDRRTADRAVLLYCAFGSMTLATLYTEPLAIALAASCLLALLDRRWLLAGALAALAGLTDPTMIVLSPVLGIAALHAVWTRREWRSLAAPLLAPLGMLGYFAYYGHQYHDYLFWFRIERAGWNQHIDWGLAQLKVITWNNIGLEARPFTGALLIAMFWSAVIGIALLIAARAPVPLIGYTVLVFLSYVLSSDAGAKPRFVLTTFGIFIGAGAKLPRFVFWPILVVSAALLIFVTGWWPHHIPPYP
jgi:hypothetical protein